ncbi:phosphoadenylyl-sulfate reductase [Agitococcus lubricus]|uniref:Adenosine 5'-phosphosulfate reductase n=1 Tax=Agitococcus lubricus TaxID=1077255 RepID=A0A2T5IWU3_9GAMM|nr:phosphoadenylyl-sulfate reductase [Agitococcus lubricus]PTQ88426.1 phosphoadenylylsulfate reductase (thioredoxin) [Agitococcus lubricus]
MSTQSLITSTTNRAGLSQETINRLNSQYKQLSFEQRISKLYQDFDANKILVTSSFAATSAYFLHIIASINPKQKIHFINTGFHFPETLAYRDFLQQKFNLDVIDVHPDPHHYQYAVNERLWETDPDLCCSVNKVQPLDLIKEQYDIWVSSLMGWESEHRATLEIFEERRGIIKFNPMIDVSREDRDNYIKTHDLPFHPLVAEGYASIGCSHCTAKGEGREGRWQGKNKTECGLHV